MLVLYPAEANNFLLEGELLFLLYERNRLRPHE